MQTLQHLNLSENEVKEIDHGAFQGLAGLGYLHFSKVRAASFTNGSFVGLSSLRVLDYQYTDTKEVDRGMFWGLSNLKQLNLIDNKISKLSAGSFYGLDKLGSLSLDHNYLTDIEQGTFEGMPILNNLAIASNKIKEISNSTFLGLSKLRALDMPANRLTRLRANTFNGLYNLDKIGLSTNQLKTIEDGAFYGLKQLAHLALQHNAITDILLKTLKGMPNLYDLLLTSNNIRHIAPGAFNESTNLEVIDLRDNKLAVIRKGMFTGLRGLYLRLDLSENQITYIEPNSFLGLHYLEVLDLGHNKITTISGTLQGLRYIWQLKLQDNQINDLEVRIFENFEGLERLVLSENRIEDIQPGAFYGLPNLLFLNLSSNLLKSIRNGVFDNLTSLTDLYLAQNRLSSLDGELFSDLEELKTLDLSNNEIQYIDERAFQGLLSLNQLFLSQNKLIGVNKTTFDVLSNLRRLEIHQNNVREISEKCFSTLSDLLYLRLSENKVPTLRNGSFEGLTKLNLLLLAENGINNIQSGAFQDLKSVNYLDLSRNSIARVTNLYLTSLIQLQYLNLAQNPLWYIDELAFTNTAELKYMNIIGTEVAVFPSKAVASLQEISIYIASGNPPSLRMFAGYWLFSTLRSSGYQCQIVYPELICNPCPLGTYSFGDVRCKPCPPGGFYQDVMPFVGLLTHGMGCKLCPQGRYISPESAPGKAESECKGCPQGTQYDRSAGFRACSCIEGFYRLDRFGACFSCPSKGLLCQNETVALRPGFYWKWESMQNLELYLNLSRNFMIFNGSYNPKRTTYNGSLPTAYACPVAESCLGGMESKCADGYQGPLCAVCGKGYYRLVSTCQKCPSVPWLIGRICLTVVISAIIIASLSLGKRRKSKNGRSVTDILMARLKIVIGFYQVTSGTLTSFSYISWPGALIKLINYAQVVQLNLLSIVPVHCFHNELKVDTYTTLTVFVAVNVLGVTIFVMAYIISKIFNSRSKTLDNNSIKRVNSSSKEQCYRNIFLLLFLTYPALSAQILQMLPAACHKICMDTERKNCQNFLRFDYSVTCDTKKFNTYVIFVYFMLAFVIGFPLGTLFLLWKSQLKSRNIALKEGKNLGEHDGLAISKEPSRPASRAEENPSTIQNKQQDSFTPGNEIFRGMRFLYENYSESCWFWEVVELARKVILTSALALVGAESRTHLGVAALVSGLYTVIFAQYKPVTDTFEHWLQLASLMATSVNMSVGMLLKIPAQAAVSSRVVTQMESIGVTILLVANNLFVSSMIIVRIGVSFFRALMSLKQQPQCNLECCLSMMMVMNDATGEATGLAEVNNRNGMSTGLDSHAPGFETVIENVTSLETETEENQSEDNKNLKGKETCK